MTETSPFSATEILARTVIEKAKATTPEQIAAIGVFRAMYAYALPVGRINEIYKAMHGYDVDVSSALPSLVRQGVLRSRVASGVRLYEVNF